MRKFYLVMCVFLFPLLSAGQEYRAGEKTYHPARQFAHWEVSAAWEGSSSEVSLIKGSSSSDGLHGVAGRVLYYPYRWAGVGIEGTYFSEKSVSPLVNSYRVHRLGVVGKLHLSPDTNPRIYLVAGAGQTSHQFKYLSVYEGMNTTKDIWYGLGGIGTEITLYRACFVLLEGRFIYNKHATLTRFYTLSKRWEGDARIGLGVRF